MKDLTLTLFAFFLLFDLGAAAQPKLQTQIRPTAKPSTVQALPVSGFVRDERGLPLAEVYITARQGSGRTIQTQSDQEGAFRLAGLHGGPVSLRFEREGYLDLDRSDFFIPGAPVNLSALSAAVTPLHEAIVLTPSQPISFIAIDELGVGIPAARIYALEFDAPHGTGASEGRLLGVADEEGRLTTRRLALGPYSILLDGGPTHPVTRFEGVHEGLGGGLGEGTFELTAPTGVPLKGRIYSSNPNRKFAVWALPVDETPPLGSTMTAQSRQGFQRVLVDNIGRFRFEGLWPNTDYWIRALPVTEQNFLVEDPSSAPVFVTTLAAPPLKERAIPEVRLDCDFRADSLRVRLSDGDGDPLANLEVQAFFEGLVDDAPIEGTTNDKGELELRGLRAKDSSGRIRLRLDAVGHAPLDYGNLLLAGGASMRLTKKRWPKLEMRQLAVLNEEEAPVAGARAIFTSERDPRISYSVTTDSSGLASFEPPKNGDTLRVTVNAPGFAPWEDRLTFAKRSPVARLTAGASLEVLVTDLDGVPLPGRLVKLSPMSNQTVAVLPRTYSQWADVQGKVQFVGLSPGRYQLVLGRSAEEVPPHLWTIVNVKKSSASEGKNLEHNFIADRPGRFAGRLLDEGQPLVGAFLRYVDAADEELSGALKKARSVMNTTTGLDGRFVLYGPPPGRHLIGVRHPNRSLETMILIDVDFERAPFDSEGSPITDGSAEPPILRYEDFDLPNGIVRGKIIDANGASIPFAEIALSPEWNVLPVEPESFLGQNAPGLAYERPAPGTRTFADEAGRFEIRGLPELRGLVLSARDGDGWTGSKRIHAVDPKQPITGLEVELLPGASELVTNDYRKIPANRPLQQAARRALLFVRDGVFSIDELPRVAHPFRLRGPTPDAPFEPVIFDELAPGRWQLLEAELDALGRILELKKHDHSRFTPGAQLQIAL